MTILPPDERKDKPPDWGEVFTTLLCHTNLTYEEIPKRTLPQITAILTRLGKHISLGWGLSVPDQQQIKEIEGEHTIEDAMQFVSLFSGIE